MALGSISTLYCWWALDKPDMPPLMVRGFVATEVAEEGHIDQQIVGSIPRVGLMLARQIREALDQAFGEVERENQTARIRGFGVFQRAPDGNEWTLTVELPLAESLGAGPHHSYP